MLLFTALSTKAVAQQYKRISRDSIEVKEGLKVDTLTIEQVVESNNKLPLERQVEQNQELFREIRKYNGVKQDP